MRMTSYESELFTHMRSTAIKQIERNRIEMKQCNARCLASYCNIGYKKQQQQQEPKTELCILEYLTSVAKREMCLTRQPFESLTRTNLKVNIKYNANTSHICH